jgi:transposase
MNELSVAEQETILGLLRLGWSARRIERETGHRRETILRYGRAAGLIKPAAARTGSKADSRPKVATDSTSAAAVAIEGKKTAAKRSSCEPHRSFIEAEFAKGRNAVAIYQDLVEHHGYVGAYNAVKRFVHSLRDGGDRKSYCRFETAPGEEAQVDYGEGAPTRDPRTGKYRKPRLFVMTLGFSRHAFRKVVWKSSSQTWCELHEEAFAYFGGVPKMIRLDNLREGVVDPDIYDAKLNALYAATLAHYGVVAVPCRPYAPDLKGKVESAVGHTQKTALAGRRFESIEQQNAHLLHWNERWAATRIHGTTKRQVREMFEEERAMLAPLPSARFEYYRILERRVHLDGHVEVDGAYYSVPARYIGAKVAVHAGRLWLRVINPSSGECVREHEIGRRGWRRTVDADRPKQTPLKLDQLVLKIARHGNACGDFAKALLSERGELAARSLFGILDLLRRYGDEPVESACAFAARANSVRYRFLRTYLERHGKQLVLRDQHRVIVGVETYTQHFTTLTSGDAS